MKYALDFEKSGWTKRFMRGKVSAPAARYMTHTHVNLEQHVKDVLKNGLWTTGRSSAAMMKARRTRGTILIRCSRN